MHCDESNIASLLKETRWHEILFGTGGLNLGTGWWRVLVLPIQSLYP